MNRNISDAAKCPFYRKETPTAIHCEGVVKGSNIVLKFANADAAAAYRKQYCNRIFGCEKCKLHRVLWD